MIEINLLPKDYLKKSFNFSLGTTGKYIIAAAAGVVIMLVAVTYFQMRQLSDLDENIVRARQRASKLQKDIQLVDALTDVKGKISDRMEAVEKLDRHRSAYVRVLEDLARNVPEFIWLGRFTENKGAESANTKGKDPKAKDQVEQAAAVATSVPSNMRNITVEGYAFTLNALAKFMINMMRSDYFDDVELVATEEKMLDKQKAFNFVVTCNLHFLSDEELRNLIAQSREESQSDKTGHKVLN